MFRLKIIIWLFNNYTMLNHSKVKDASSVLIIFYTEGIKLNKDEGSPSHPMIKHQSRQNEISNSLLKR
jgi:hypothetical protein